MKILYCAAKRVLRVPRFDDFRGIVVANLKYIPFAKRRRDQTAHADLRDRAIRAGWPALAAHYHSTARKPCRSGTVRRPTRHDCLPGASRPGGASSPGFQEDAWPRDRGSGGAGTSANSPRSCCPAARGEVSAHARSHGETFGTLLDLTFGGQLTGNRQGVRVLFKTSPSGGACHPIEGRLAWRVRGFSRQASITMRRRRAGCISFAAELRQARGLLSERPGVVWWRRCAGPDDRTHASRLVALSARSLTAPSFRNRTLLPDVLSGRHVARPRALLHDGARRRPNQARSEDRRDA